MEKITFSLPQNSLSMVRTNNTIEGYVYDTLNSTNNQAWQLSQTDAQLPFFVIAKQQTAGKGQRGKVWVSDRGGLYLSLYLPLDLPVNSAHHLTLLTAVGIVQQLRKNQIEAQIKWLNDLILHGKKLGGILCETKIKNSKIHQAVIGVGINYQNSTIHTGVNLASNLDDRNDRNLNLLDYHQPINLYNMVVEGILNSYHEYLTIGVEKIVNDYNQLLYNLHDTVTIKENKGRIDGCDSQGNLKLKISSGNASSKVKLSPEKYRISYQKINNHYLITEIENNM